MRDACDILNGFVRENCKGYKNAQPVGEVSEEYLVPYINDLDPTENRAIAPRITNDKWQVDCRPKTFAERWAQGTPQNRGQMWIDRSKEQHAVYVKVRDGWEEFKWEPNRVRYNPDEQIKKMR